MRASCIVIVDPPKRPPFRFSHIARATPRPSTPACSQKLSSSDSLVGLSHVGRILKDWQRRELGSDGGAELAAVIAGVRPEERAARRRQIEAALARIVQARDGSV